MTRHFPQVRPHLAQLPGYAPVVPLVERARAAGLDPQDCLKLDANENPYGMLPAVREALQAAIQNPHFGSIYPDPNQVVLREALADYHQFFPPDWFIAGAGADELLDLIFRALLPPGGTVITCPPSFGMYPFLADVNELKLVEVPRLSRFQISRAKLLKAVDAAPPGSIVVLTSPNNPSGDTVPFPLLHELLERNVTVIIDEAYAEFAINQYPSTMLLPEAENLIIVRTLSKWAGIAGLRLGYAIADPDLIDDLFRLKQPYNVNHAAEVAAIAALHASVERGTLTASIRRTRRQLFDALQTLDGLDPLKSQANFILVEIDSRLGTGRDLHDRLAAVGVFVRHYSDERLAQHIRISIPRDDQLETLTARLQSAL